MERLSDWALPWSNFSSQAGQMPLSFLFGPNFEEEKEPALELH
jgi:hypothetical protein